MKLRSGKLEDLAILQKLFVDTVRTICRKDYNQKQIEVWTSGIKNVKRWEEILLTQFVLVAQQENQIIGFATLDNGNYIDLFFVHQYFQRQGVGQELYTEIEIEAKRQGQTELTSDVSKTARSFFEYVGFIKVKEQKNIKQGVEFVNFKMIKQLR